MPTDVTKTVSTLGVVGEALGIGDAVAVDKSEKIKEAVKADLCCDEYTGNVSEEAAATGASIEQDIESHRMDF